MDILKSLPDDISPTVFKFLPLKDRKIWRLINKKWYTICSRAEVIEREKFVFRFGRLGNDANRLAECIVNCARLRPTIEFHGLPLRQSPLILWEHFGNRITSLSIHECDINDEIVIHIISHCPNLIHFHLQQTLRDDILSSEHVLDDLIMRRVERPKLRSFKFFTHFSTSNVMLHKILQIFPNIEVFGRDFSHFDNTPINTATTFFAGRSDLPRIELRIFVKGTNFNNEVKMLMQVLKGLPGLRSLKFCANSGVQFNESDFAEFFQAIRRIESLDLDFPYIYFDTASLHPLPAIEYDRLTHLRLKYDNHIQHANLMIIEILRRCTSLTHLGLFLNSINDEILECIFRNHTKLRKLRFCAVACTTAFTGKYNIDRLQNLEHFDFYAPGERIDFNKFVSKLNHQKLTFFQTGYLKHHDVSKLPNTLSVKVPLIETLRLDSVPAEIYLPICQKLKKLRFLIIDNNTETGSNHVMIERLFKKCSSLIYVINTRFQIAYFYNRDSKRLLENSSWNSNEPICCTLNLCDASNEIGPYGERCSHNWRNYTYVNRLLLEL